MDRAAELTRVTPDRVPADFSRGLVEYKLKESDDQYAKRSFPEALRKLRKPSTRASAPHRAEKERLLQLSAGRL